jgi:hypothetical protein
MTFDGSELHQNVSQGLAFAGGVEKQREDI